MSPLAARVARFLRSRALVAPGDRLVVALSGGPDSVALFHLLQECARSLGITMAGIAHLHHGLRGPDADADEAFCRALATAAGVPACVGRADVGALARARRCSVEVAGHVARAEFYARARTSLGASLVATGHTANDRAETVLLHLGRGAGLRGLGGIRDRAGHVVRPLLEVERPEVLRYLASRGQAFREDATNADVAIARNRVRHRVLPALEEHLSPRVVGALCRLADLAADDEDVLGELARERGAGVLRMDGAMRTLDGVALRRQPRAMRRRIVEEAIRQVAGGHRPGLVHVEAVLSLASSERLGACLHLPGVVAVVMAEGLRLRPAGVDSAGRGPGEGPAARNGGARRRLSGREGGQPAAGAIAQCQIPIPGVLRDEHGRWALTARLGPPMDEVAARSAASAGGVAVLDAERAGAPLFVRSRRPGDRLRPLGLGGRRKLQDVLVDARVPRSARDEVPLVVDASDRILWVVGHCISDYVRVSGRTTGVLLLEFRHLGG
jgi:tRNA(Ile)-lysidine synthase